jgi:chorismate synthase
MILYNQDFDPSAYSEIVDKFRPGHADWTYLMKYGIRDHRGSGRASGRETAGRVAAGAIAMKLLEKRGVKIVAHSQKVAGIACTKYDPTVIEQNPLRAADLEAAEKMLQKISAVKETLDSVGGIIECRVTGLAPGLGEPVFDKLDALLAHAMLSVGAVKGIEFGTGFAAADMLGSEHNDPMDASGFISNNAGGVIGGISSGAELIFRVVVKPTSSIARPQKSLNLAGQEVQVITEGRHDTCICPRIVPVIESMTALVLEDLYKRQAAMLA